MAPLRSWKELFLGERAMKKAARLRMLAAHARARSSVQVRA